MKKLQAEVQKGDKQTLNEEMMKLYREHGVNPIGGCLPMLIQFPVFIVLYDVIKRFTNTVKTGHDFISAAGKAILCQHGPFPRLQHAARHQALCEPPHHNGQMPARSG